MNRDDAIEEYKALREEILTLSTRQGNRLTTAWAGFGAIISAASIGKIPELAWISLAIIGTAWRDHLILSESISKIGAYIEVVIENSTELRWEKTLTNSIERPRITCANSESTKKIIFSEYGIASILSVFISTIIFVSFFPMSLERFISNIFIAIICSIPLYISITEELSAWQRRQYWRELLRSQA